MKTTYLKPGLLLAICLFFSQLALAQKPMASPRDSVSGKAGKAHLTINYGSPSVKARKIWGDLVPYNKVWRAGANEATTITTDQPLQIEGKTLPAGKYSFFAIPTDKTWTLVFNKTSNQWGAYEYSEKQDALRVTVTPKKSAAFHERLVYKINDKGFSLLWENLEVPVTTN